MGWVGEEDNAGAGGYSPCSYHRVHKLRVKGHIPRPQGVTGVVAAEDDAAMAVVIVLVPRVDDHRAIRELVGLSGEKRASGRPRAGTGPRAGSGPSAPSLREQGWLVQSWEARPGVYE